jgi:hypothetical protein
MITNSTDGVRAAVGAMEREVALLGRGNSTGEPTGEPDGLEPLRTSWRALVDALALGPDPEYRACPYCGATGMRAATRCGTCWKVLVPPPTTAVGHWGQAR